MMRQQNYLQEWPSFAAAINVSFVFICGLSCISVSAAFPTSSPNSSPNTSKVTNCNQVCRYEKYFRRAHCDQRSLRSVPAPTGCEGVLLLELQGNNIPTVTAEQMSQYIYVGTLDISNNQIATLDTGTFLNNQKLRNIIISHNKLQVLKSGTFNGTEKILARIFLDDNELETIEDNAFQGLRKVTAISLNNNRLQYLPNNVFNDLTELTRLSLSNNSLLEIKRECFRNLNKLQILLLDGNKLTEIPARLFDGLHDLKEVNLSSNLFNIIPPPEDLGLHHVQVLDLTNNKLNQSTTVIPFLSNVSDLVHFGGNPLSCDCNFKILQNWFYKTSDSQQSSLFSSILLGCVAYNGTFVVIQSNLTLRCIETDTTGSPQVDVSSSTDPFEKQTKDPQLHDTQGEGNDKSSQNTDLRKMEVEFKAGWISYYTATVLTLYVIIRFVMWLVKTCKHPDTCKIGSVGHG